MIKKESKRISNMRAEELRKSIEDYQITKLSIKTGYDNYDQRMELKSKILSSKNACEQDWNNWKWQYKNRITTIEELSSYINFSKEELQEIEKVGKEFRWAITPYYLSLMSLEDKNCAIRLQALPQVVELIEEGKTDPMGEEFTSPVDGITRRYPDRLIINVTNTCGMYCRHCQRRRNIGGVDVARSKESFEECIEYIRNNPEIRDVLLTGGDALLIDDSVLEWLLQKLREIDTVEIIRLGTRTPVVMPQRITDEFCEMVKKYSPIYLNTHFNNPSEITEETKEACDKLSLAGVVLGNQAVLLKGINDNSDVMKKLNQELLKIRVKPYYVFHPKDVIGTHHFYVSIARGIEIMSELRGKTSGLANPVYIVNAPKGLGKIPIQKNYIVKSDKNQTVLKNWEGREVVIDESFLKE